MRNAPSVLIMLALLPLHASLVSAQTPGPRPSVDPVDLFVTPIRSPLPRSRIGLNLMYARSDLAALIRGSSNASVDAVVMSLDLKYAPIRALQLSLSIPFMTHASVSTFSSSSNTQFGNLRVGLLGRLVDVRFASGRLALAAFAETTLPTTTASIQDRRWAVLDTGFSAVAQFGPITATVNLSAFWGISGSSSDLTYINTALLLAYSPHRVISLQMGTKLGAMVHPTVDGEPATSLVFALRINPINRLHIELGTQVALNDHARVLHNQLARASLLVGVSYSFSGVPTR